MSSATTSSSCNEHQQQSFRPQLGKKEGTPSSSSRSAVLYYRDVCGNGVTLVETSHGYICNSGDDAASARHGAIEYVLKQESRRGLTGTDLGLLCLGLALWTANRSPVYALLGLLGLALLFRCALFADKTIALLLVESVGVHITNQKTIFGALEEYLPWNSIKDVFINEVISEKPNKFCL